MIKTNEGLMNGIHAYVSIGNLDALVAQDENRSNSIIHILHLINYLYIGVEEFISRYTVNDVVPIYIEKATGSRLHLFFVESQNMLDIFKDFCGYCFKLFEKVNQNPKYKTLNNASLNIGAEYGQSLYYIFREDNTEEPTSIGFTPNIGAKIQTELKNKFLGVGPKLYEKISGDDTFSALFSAEDNVKLSKYNIIMRQTYLSKVANLVFDRKMENLIEKVEQAIKSSRLGDVKIITPRDKENLEIRSLNSVGYFNAIVISADIRGSTASLEKVSLEESIMKIKTSLSTMYNICKTLDGVHVQFQGDKELLYFNKGNEEKAIKYALELVDKIKGIGFHVGIGISSGEIYTTKFGKNRNSIFNKKEVGLFGQTLKEANRLEDEYAGEDEIYISKSVYDKLPERIKNIFSLDGQYYKTKEDLKSFRNIIDCSNNFNERQDVNKAWSK